MDPEKADRCNQCPRMCRINRNTERGFCKAPEQLKINLYQLHFGEEPVISGKNGSGTIFFSHCNMRCVYCQNYKVSNWGNGRMITPEELAEIMLELQEKNATNINLVTPSHYPDLIKKALIMAKDKGLNIPVIWNSNGYDSVEKLKELEGLIDIYLPDFKYWSNNNSLTYSDTQNYPDIAKLAIKEMFRQVGHLKIDEDSQMAYRGLMIRLLVLPENINEIQFILDWIYEEFGNSTYISLMSQYYPTHRSTEFPEINRAINREEYDYAVHILEGLGFENGFTQELGITPEWTPSFKE